MSMQQMTLNETFVSVILLPVDSHQLSARRLDNIYKNLSDSFTDFEIIIISNGLHGNEAISKDIFASIPSIRYIQLSVPVSQDVACAAGVENSIGDYVVILTESDPASAILPMVQMAQTTCDVVIGKTKSKRSLAYRMVRPFINKVLREIGYNLPEGATHLCCLSRRAVNAVLRSGRFHQQFFMRIQRTGYQICSYEYELEADGAAKTLWSGILDLTHLIVFNSTKPLRWMSMLGFAGGFSAFSFAVYSLLVNLMRGHVVEGWTSLVLIVSCLFMLMFIILAFFGEYLGRLLDEHKERDEYTIAAELTSVVMTNPHRLNVISVPTEKDVNVHQEK